MVGMYSRTTVVGCCASRANEYRFCGDSGGLFQAGEFHLDSMTLVQAFIELSVVDSSRLFDI